MSLMNSTAYRAKPPRPEVDLTALPRYGMGRLETYDPTSREFNIVLATEHQEFQDFPEFQLPRAEWWDYYYYIAPAALGEATFRYSGMVGGWDGASWPLDDMSDVYGPVDIEIDGQPWRLWRSDWPGNMGGTYSVTFENG